MKVGNGNGNGAKAITIAKGPDQKRIREALVLIEQAYQELWLIDLRTYRGTPKTKELITGLRMKTGKMALDIQRCLAVGT